MSARTEMWRRRLALLAAAGLFAAGNLAVYLTYRSSTQTRRESLEARRDDLKRSVDAGESEAARLATQRERLSGVSAAMEEFYGRRIGSQRETLAAIVSEVHAILNQVGVSTTQISYATTEVQKLPLTQMRISFSAHCDYARFKRLLRAFEASRRWIAIRSIAITRDTEQPGAVQVQLDLLTYFAASDRPPESAEKGAVPVRRAG